MSNIRVAVRVRPLSEKEKDDGSKEIVTVTDNSVTIENVKLVGIPEFGDSRARFKEFTFDHCYDSMRSSSLYSTQSQVFQDLGGEVLKAACDGFNACVFAYGQTGTGKTHTMMGHQDDPGLIPRICQGLFSQVSDEAAPHITCRVDISYLEIYNERVRDLLQPYQFQQNPKFSLKVRNHPREGPYVEGLSWHRVKNNEEIQALIDKGNEYRATAETYIHDRSSRSHAIVTVCFTQARLEENRPSEIVSKINLVDLAGSERADPSSKPDFRKRLTEGANINRSLVTLGYIIKALAEKSLLSWDTDDLGSLQNFSSSGGGESIASNSPSGPNKQRAPFIPYRDSVLTWLLKDSLGGNSKTIMIATITPASQYYSETISTLRYAQRAKNIINKPRINEDNNVALIRELRREIERLQVMLADARKGGNLLSLPYSEDSIIAEKLHENEEMESDLSIRGLRNQANSMGVMIDSQLPYLIGMDDDVLSTGVVIFHLKEGDTYVGRDNADKPQDIVLIGPNILTEHCVIRNKNGEVTLNPYPGSLCSVQGQECVEPTKLTQGDYVILGGDQVFRFNNPTEAAKLREHRRSQGSLNTLSTSHLSFGGLSRASSYSSIGDDANSLSPFSQLGRSYPNYAARDLCLELEKKYQSEQDRIDLARQELEQLREEHERAEDLRLEKEEQMYIQHEQHKQDLEDQKQHLARLIAENERARVKAEEELRHARESLAKEKEMFQKEIDAERKRLKELQKLEKQQTVESSGFQTDSPSTATTSTGSDEDTPPDRDGYPSKPKMPRRLSVEEQLKELEESEFSRRMSYRETEQSLSIQEEDIEDQYLQTQEQIQAKLKKIKETEAEYKELDKLHLQEINSQGDKLKELHKKEAQLEVYIQEKEELINVSTGAPTHLRSASSELYLAGQSIELPDDIEQKTSSLQNIQSGLKEEGDQMTYSPRALQRSASAESLESDRGISLTESISKNMEDKKEKKSKKDFKISNAARDVTSRLYTPPAPKFKYVPKVREKEVKLLARTRVVRDKDNEQNARGSPSRVIRESSKEHSPSSQRQKHHYSSPARDAGTRGVRSGKSGDKKPESDRKKPGDKKTEHGNAKKVCDVEGRTQLASSSKTTTSQSPDRSSNISPHSGRLGSSGKLRQIASASNLASVPESVCEGNDDLGLEATIPKLLIKRRNKRGRSDWDDDEFRTRSAPDSQAMAAALDQYTEEMNAEKVSSSTNVINFSAPGDESQMITSHTLSDKVDDMAAEMESESGLDLTSENRSDINETTDLRMDIIGLQIISGNLENSDTSVEVPRFFASADDIEINHSSSDSAFLKKGEHMPDSEDISYNLHQNESPVKKSKTHFKSDRDTDFKNLTYSDDSLDLSSDSLENQRSTQSLPNYLPGFEHTAEAFNDSLEEPEGNDNRSSAENTSYNVDIANWDFAKTSSKKGEQYKACNLAFSKIVCHDNIDSLDREKMLVDENPQTVINCQGTSTLYPSDEMNKEICPRELSIPVVDSKTVIHKNEDNSVAESGATLISSVYIKDKSASKSISANGADVSEKNVDVNIPGSPEKGNNITKPDALVSFVEGSEDHLEENPRNEEILECEKSGKLTFNSDSVNVDGKSIQSRENYPVNETMDVRADKDRVEPDKADEVMEISTISGCKAEEQQLGVISGDEEICPPSLIENGSIQGSVIAYETVGSVQSHEIKQFVEEVVASAKEICFHQKVYQNSDILQLDPGTNDLNNAKLGNIETEKEISDVVLKTNEDRECTDTLPKGSEDQKRHPTVEIDGKEIRNTAEEADAMKNIPKDDTVDLNFNNSVCIEKPLNSQETDDLESVCATIMIVNDLDNDTVKTICSDDIGSPGKIKNTLTPEVENIHREHNRTRTEPECGPRFDEGPISDQHMSKTRLTTDSNNNLTNEDVNELDCSLKEEQIGALSVEPRTRSIGICTSPDVELEDREEDSNDSVIDADEELLVLQEALEQLPAKPVPPGPQLSTARRAARQRAMIRQKQRAGDSDGVGQLSDESPVQSSTHKSTSRPDSGSRRRKRPTNNRNNPIDQTSDDYDSSENDSLYSDDSVDNVKCFESQNGFIQNHKPSNDEDVFKTDTDTNDAQCRIEEDMLPRHLRKRHQYTYPQQQSLENVEIQILDENSRSVGVQTLNRHARGFSSSSLRTDLSDIENSFASGEFGGMAMSPVSLWNSNEGQGCERNSSSSSGIIRTLSDLEKSLSQAQRSSSKSNGSFVSQGSNLEQGPTEVWSSSTSDLRPLSSFRDDLSYVMESEVMSPGTYALEYSNEGQSQVSVVQQPSAEGEQSLPRPDCSTPRSERSINISFPESQIQQVKDLDSNTPVKFEVTVHEDTTNILYNVEKTEYRTYSLRNQSSNREPGIIPDSIHVNIRECITSQTLEKFESSKSESVHVKDESKTDNECDTVVIEKKFKSVYSSERELDVENNQGSTGDVTTRFTTEDETKNYILPAHVRDQSFEKKKTTPNLQQSGVLSATSYINSNAVSQNGELPKLAEDQLNESECTSDYGTITSIDGRKGFLSFTSDFEDDSMLTGQFLSAQSEAYNNDLMLSQAPVHDELVHEPHQDNNEEPMESVTTSIEMSIPSEFKTHLYEVRHGNVEDENYFFEQAEEIFEDLRPQDDSSDNDSINENCEKDGDENELDIDRRNVSTVGPIGVINSQETLVDGELDTTDNTESIKKCVNVQNNDQISETVDEEGNIVENTLQLGLLKDQTVSFSSAEDSFVSVERAETSSCSSDYRTPQQSPVHINDTEEIWYQIEEVIIPDLGSENMAFALIPTCENLDSAHQSQPLTTSSPKRPVELRTVSVNTDSSSTPTTPQSATAKLSYVFKSGNDPGQIEAVRREIETKIAKIQNHSRSLSDSAISSDFTDGDSVSLSPRTNKHYEFDKNLFGDKRSNTKNEGDISRQVPVRLKKAVVSESCDITIFPLSDSGNVFDQEMDEDTQGSRISPSKQASKSNETNTESALECEELVSTTIICKFPENVIEAALALKPFPVKRSLSLDSIATLVNTGTIQARAVRGSVVSEIPVLLKDKQQNDEHPDSERLTQSDKQTIVLTEQATDPTDPVNLNNDNGPQQIFQKNQTQSFPSSFYRSERRKEYHRSLSDGNLEDFEGSHNSSADSDDSITFVFVGKDYGNGIHTNGKEDQQNFNDQCKENHSLKDVKHGSNDAMNYVNISSKGVSPCSNVNGYEAALSGSASGESGDMYKTWKEEDDDQESSHSASQEIEDLIDAGHLKKEFVENRDISAGDSGESASTCSDNIEVYKRDNVHDSSSSPLRHKFGIDEKVLPISERSVSADNIPKQLTRYKDIQRSRSTGMIDVGVIVEPESESDVFPPAPISYDEDQTDPSFSLRTMSESGMDQISQRTVSDIAASLSNRSSADLETSSSGSISSARVRSVCSIASSSAEESYEEIVINYSNSREQKKRKRQKQEHESVSSEGEIDIQTLEERQAHIKHVLDTVEKFILPRPVLIDRGVSTENENGPMFVSIGLQTSVENISDPGGKLEHIDMRSEHCLPALAAPFRAQSMDSFGLGQGAEYLNLSEGAISWVKMSELMIETTNLLRNINDRLPEMDRNASISSTDDSKAILKQWEEISVQTGQSLTNLQNVGLQTDEVERNVTDLDACNRIEETNNHRMLDEYTQVDDNFRMKPLDSSDIITYEVIPFEAHTDSCEISIQTDFDSIDLLVTEAAKLALNQRETFNQHVEIQSHTENELFVGDKNESSVGETNKKLLSSNTKVELGRHQHGQMEGKFISQIKTDLGVCGNNDTNNKLGKDKSNLQKSDYQQVLEGKSVLPGFTLPNTKEIEELREEHAKLMENLRKASEQRQNRKDTIKSRKQVSAAPNVRKYNSYEDELGESFMKENAIGDSQENVEVNDVGPGKSIDKGAEEGKFCYEENEDREPSNIPGEIGDPSENVEIIMVCSGKFIDDNELEIVKPVKTDTKTVEKVRLESLDSDNFTHVSETDHQEIRQVGPGKYLNEDGTDAVLPVSSGHDPYDPSVNYIDKYEKQYLQYPKPCEKECESEDLSSGGADDDQGKREEIKREKDLTNSNKGRIDDFPFRYDKDNFQIEADEAGFISKKKNAEEWIVGPNAFVRDKNASSEMTNAAAVVFKYKNDNRPGEMQIQEENNSNEFENFNKDAPDSYSKNLKIEMTEIGQGVYIHGNDLDTASSWVVGPGSYVLNTDKSSEMTKIKTIISQHKDDAGKDEVQVKKEDRTNENEAENVGKDVSNDECYDYLQIEITETGQGVYITELDNEKSTWIVGPGAHVLNTDESDESVISQSTDHGQEAIKCSTPSDNQDLIKINIQVDPDTGLKVENKLSSEANTKHKLESPIDKLMKTGKTHEHTWKLKGDEIMAISDERPVSCSSSGRLRSESNASVSSVDTITSKEQEKFHSHSSGKQVSSNPMDLTFVDDDLSNDHSAGEKSHNVSQEEETIFPVIHSKAETVPKLGDLESPNSERKKSDEIIKCVTSPKFPSEKFGQKYDVPSPIEIGSYGTEENDFDDSKSDTSMTTINESFTEVIEIKPKIFPNFSSEAKDEVIDKEKEHFERDEDEEKNSFQNDFETQNKEQGNESDPGMDTVDESFTEIIETKPACLPFSKNFSPDLQKVKDEPSGEVFHKSMSLAQSKSEQADHEIDGKSDTSMKTVDEPFVGVIEIRSESLPQFIPVSIEHEQFGKKECLEEKEKAESEKVSNFPPEAQRNAKVSQKSRHFGKTDDATQVSMEFSDDFTQTDNDNFVYAEKIVTMDHEQKHPSSNLQQDQPINASSEKLKEDLEKLQLERQHILDLLGLNYLPTSLTVELLEAKLNYCIGQTDLLLDSVEDEFGTSDTRPFTKEQQRAVDYISKYRADLKKSKQDIQECREKLDHRRGMGIGRGRTSVRKRDVLNQHRQAFIDAFKLERMREQQDYERSRHGTPVRGNTPLKGNTPLIGNSPVVTPRSERSRSSSPKYFPGYMTPSEHKDHLVDLRRQLIHDITEEEQRHRSLSPVVSNPIMTSPTHHRFRSPPETHLGFSPKVAVSSTCSPETPYRSYSTYVIAPGVNDISASPRSVSLDSTRPRTYQSSPSRHATGTLGRHLSPPSTFDRQIMAEGIFSPQESAQICREIEEMKRRTPGMSAPLEEMLRRSSFSSGSSHRSSSSRAEASLSTRTRSDSRHARPRTQSPDTGRYELSISPRTGSVSSHTRPRTLSPDTGGYDNPLSLNLDSLQDDTQGPYSPYSAYAREHIIPNERSSGGVLRGSYQLYDDRSDTSSNISFGSDTHLDSRHYQGLDEETVKRLRPIKSSDIKSKIGRHKR